MFYPTGKTTGTRCLVCMNDEKPAIEECMQECDSSTMTEALKKWLDENQYCVECWQMKEYLTQKGVSSAKLDEDMGAAAAPAAPAAPAGGPAGSAFATLGTTTGMGIVAPPTNGGTNAGFYDSSKDGSGDKFPSLTVGTPAAKKRHKKGSGIASFLDFIKRRKK